MATTVVLTSVEQKASGKVFIRFSGGIELEFDSIDDVREWAQSADADEGLTQQMCVAWADTRGGGLLGSLATIKDKNFTFDLSSQNAIRVQ